MRKEMEDCLFAQIEIEQSLKQENESLILISKEKHEKVVNLQQKFIHLKEKLARKDGLHYIVEEKYMNEIAKWSKKNSMRVNEKEPTRKYKKMVHNFERFNGDGEYEVSECREAASRRIKQLYDELVMRYFGSINLNSPPLSMREASYEGMTEAKAALWREDFHLHCQMQTVILNPMARRAALVAWARELVRKEGSSSVGAV
ncbi:hypothetical protein GIB67_034695 [Kingdonia uniflora]|uniref:Uncharacterized protein n=1 Tax=Kingdonia uniflora TaxID=39325 RepID=A0A7J7P0H7_9MAGN|nr:hypothetical protein GIB67_034695 [Kingdonia uniflora]